MTRPLILAALCGALIGSAQAQAPGQVGTEGSQIYFAAGTPLDAEGRSVVRYGVFKALGGPADSFVLGRAKNGDMCSNAAFGSDPFPGSLKACYVVKKPVCKPAQLGGPGSVAVQSFSARGAWAGWWCKDEQGVWNPRLVVVTAKMAANINVWKLASAWLETQDVSDLDFGADPFADPALRAVWVPEVAKIDAVKPK